jgi:hypothetical protein
VVEIIDKKFPSCPICGDTLAPLSSIYGTTARVPVEKTYSHWICLKCGFYFGTGGTAGYNLKDINVGLLPEIPEIVEMLAKSPKKRQFFHLK